MNEGSIAFAGNVFWNMAVKSARIATESAGFPETDTVKISPPSLAATFAANGNSVGDPSVTISRTKDGQLNPNPGNTSVLNGATPATDTWFDNVTYKGAFDGTNNWLSGWTALSSMGYTQ